MHYATKAYEDWDDSSLATATDDAPGTSKSKESNHLRDDLASSSADGSEMAIATTTTASTDSGMSNKRRPVMLLEWITREQNRRSTLRDMAEQCIHTLETITETESTRLQTRNDETLKPEKLDEMKVLKGLALRLSGLDSFLREATEIVKNQAEFVKAFQQNLARANNVGDSSILPDLCETHCKQLQEMLQKFYALRVVRGKVGTAKHELAQCIQAKIG